MNSSIIAELPPISKAEIAKMPMEEVITTTQILQSTPPDVRTTESELIELSDLPIGDYNDITSSDKDPSWTDGLEQIVKDQAGELLKDAIGFGLIGIGSWLANPVGPEDLASPGPVDEIIGGILIGAGRFIMWI